MLPMNAMAQKVVPGSESGSMKPLTGTGLSYVTLQPPSQPLSLVQDHRPSVYQTPPYIGGNVEEPETEKLIPNGVEITKTETEQDVPAVTKQNESNRNNNLSPENPVQEQSCEIQPEQVLTSLMDFPLSTSLSTPAQNKVEEKKAPVNNGSKESDGKAVNTSVHIKQSPHKPEDVQAKNEVPKAKPTNQSLKVPNDNAAATLTSTYKPDAKVTTSPKTTKRKSRELKDLKVSAAAADGASKPKRNRIQTQPYQSPLPEIALLVKSLNKTPSSKTADDKLIVFYKNEFLAVRNAEGSFYVCQAMQNIYKSSRRIRIRWLSQDKTNGEFYSPDFYDTIDFDCILTNLNLNKVDKHKFWLTRIELLRTENILKRAIDVEAGVSEKPRVTEEHPDGLDLSLYKDESQLKRRKGLHNEKPNQRKKSKRAASSTDDDADEEESDRNRKTPKTSRAKKRSVNKALAIAKSVAKGSSRAERALNATIRSSDRKRRGLDPSSGRNHRKMDAKSQRVISGLLLFALATLQLGYARNDPNYYGTLIGPLQEYAHGIKGTVYAVDDATMFIKGFSYDGTGPDAYFWVGNTSRPNPDGYIVPYPESDSSSDPRVLEAYNHTDILLRLPGGKRIRDIKWLSVWCRRFTVDFGDVFIPPDLKVPKLQVLPEFSRLAHGLRSGNISILDSKTIYIPNLHYDGGGPDAYFWVGNGSEPNRFGIKVPNEVGSLEPLRGYLGEDIEIVLPDNLTVYDIDWLAVWCVEYRHNFGHVLIPKDLDVPPALGQTKITPPWWYNPTSSTPTPKPVNNCKEMLGGRVQVTWELMGEDVQIRISGRIREDQYVAFGLSGKDGQAEMIGGDVVVIGYDNRTGKFIAEDYYMSDIAQCDGKRGVCPDERIGGRNDVMFVHGERKNGITTVTYTRPLRTNEPVQDKMIPERETSVIAAIGPLNARGEANAHERFDKTTEDIRIDFTSNNVHECTNSLYNIPDTPEIESWKPAVIKDKDTFTARIGPTGSKKGYSRITGTPSWGIAWYINDLLIPEITVKRGQTYTFIVEGGNDTSNPAKYHPFYITDSPEGGFGQKSEAEQMEQKVFAGVKYDSTGYPFPTAAGRYCEWVRTTVDNADNYETFESFFKTLELKCEKGEPAKLIWTVEKDTPDLVYYQCYTHNHLGWKINVVSSALSQGNINSINQVLSGFTTFMTSIIAFLLFSR